MRFSAITIALVLLVIAVPFLLERMDLISAKWLRLEPPAIAIVIATAIIVLSLRAVRRGGKKK